MLVLKSLFNKLSGFQACNSIKERLWRRCVPVNFAKFLRTPFFKEHLRWLFLFANQNNAKRLNGININLMAYRSSRWRCSLRKGVLRNFAKLTGKYLCQTLNFNKVAGLRAATLLRKRLWHRCFPVVFVKFLRTPFCTEHLWATASGHICDCVTNFVASYIQSIQ